VGLQGPGLSSRRRADGGGGRARLSPVLLPDALACVNVLGMRLGGCGMGSQHPSNRSSMWFVGAGTRTSNTPSGTPTGRRTGSRTSGANPAEESLPRMAGAPAQQEIHEPTSKYFRRRVIAELMYFLLGQCSGSAVIPRKTRNCSRGCDGRATGSALGSLSEQYRSHWSPHR
jgi:hypothetical protein